MCNHNGYAPTDSAFEHTLTKQEFWATSTNPKVTRWLKRARNAYCSTIFLLILALSVSTVFCVVPSLFEPRQPSSITDGFVLLFSIMLFAVSLLIVIIALLLIVSIHRTRNALLAFIISIGMGLSQIVFMLVFLSTKGAVGVVPLYIYCIAQFLAFCSHVYTTFCYYYLDRLYRYAPLEAVIRVKSEDPAATPMPTIGDNTKAHFLSTTADERVKKLLRTSQHLFVALCGIACISIVLLYFVLELWFIPWILGLLFLLASWVAFQNKSILVSLLAIGIVLMPCSHVLLLSLRAWTYMSALRNANSTQLQVILDITPTVMLYVLPILIPIAFSICLTVIYFKIHLAYRRFQKEQ